MFVAFEHDLARPLGMIDWNVYHHGSYHYRADILGGSRRYPNYAFRLSARDITLFGQLYLNNGIWNRRQLLSPEWIARSTAPVSRTEHQAGLLGTYGYCWWVAGPSEKLIDRGITDGSYSAIGFGGNFLTIIPDLDMVVTAVTDTATWLAGSSASRPELTMTNDCYQELLLDLAIALS